MKALALGPALAILVLGGGSVGRLAGDPAWIGGLLRTLGLTGAATVLAWPVGVMAAAGLWGAQPGVRRFVLGLAIATLLLPPRIVALGLPDGRPAVLTAHAAGAACVVLLVMTATLNGLDPRVMQAAAACGASPLRGWCAAVVPFIAWPMVISAAAALSFALGQAALDAALTSDGGATLSAMAATAVRSGRADAAPGALMLLCLAVAPLAFLCLAGVVLSVAMRSRRRSGRPYFQPALTLPHRQGARK